MAPPSQDSTRRLRLLAAPANSECLRPVRPQAAQDGTLSLVVRPDLARGAEDGSLSL